MSFVNRSNRSDINLLPSRASGESSHQDRRKNPTEKSREKRNKKGGEGSQEGKHPERVKTADPNRDRVLIAISSVEGR